MLEGRAALGLDVDGGVSPNRAQSRGGTVRGSHHSDGEKHLLRTIREYLANCNEYRPHQALDGNSPVLRRVKRKGEVMTKPVHGGLHHEYSQTP